MSWDRHKVHIHGQEAALFCSHEKGWELGQRLSELKFQVTKVGVRLRRFVLDIQPNPDRRVTAGAAYPLEVSMHQHTFDFRHLSPL